MINILLYVTIITIILIWAIWDCFEISHITKYHQFIIPHLLEHQHRKTLLTLILGSNGLMLVLKPYLQSYPLTLVCLALLVMSVQDLLTGYVNILFAWAIFFLVFYLQIHTLTFAKLNINLCLALILMICIDYQILGSGDFPLILTFQILLSPQAFSYLLILAAMLTYTWLTISKHHIVPFIPSLSTAYWSLILLNLI